MKRFRDSFSDARFLLALLVMICYCISVFTKEVEEFKELEHIVTLVLAFYFGSQSSGKEG